MRLGFDERVYRAQRAHLARYGTIRGLRDLASRPWGWAPSPLRAGWIVLGGTRLASRLSWLAAGALACCVWGWPGILVWSAPLGVIVARWALPDCMAGLLVLAAVAGIPGAGVLACLVRETCAAFLPLEGAIAGVVLLVLYGPRRLAALVRHAFAQRGSPYSSAEQSGTLLSGPVLWLRVSGPLVLLGWESWRPEAWFGLALLVLSPIKNARLALPLDWLARVAMPPSWVGWQLLVDVVLNFRYRGVYDPVRKELNR